MVLKVMTLCQTLVVSDLLAKAATSVENPQASCKATCAGGFQPQPVFEPQIWLEVMTSRDAQRAGFKGAIGIFSQKKIASCDGCSLLGF